MKIIKRNQYLDRLIGLQSTPDIKIITGLRRAGKSELVHSFISWIKDSVEKSNIIFIDFADLRYDELKSYKALYSYAENHCIDGANNILIVDEVQLCFQFELAINSLYNCLLYIINFYLSVMSIRGEEFIL